MYRRENLMRKSYSLPLVLKHRRTRLRSYCKGGSIAFRPEKFCPFLMKLLTLTPSFVFSLLTLLFSYSPCRLMIVLLSKGTCQQVTTRKKTDCCDCDDAESPSSWPFAAHSSSSLSLETLQKGSKYPLNGWHSISTIGWKMISGGK